MSHVHGAILSWTGGITAIAAAGCNRSIGNRPMGDSRPSSPRLTEGAGQKTYFNASCTIRGSAAVAVIKPKSGLFNSDTG
jgi:hypothetical protein